MKQKDRIIIGLVVLVLVFASIIAYNFYEEKQLERDFQFYQTGQLQTLAVVWQQTDNCEVMGMTIGNQTRSLVDVGCLE